MRLKEEHLVEADHGALQSARPANVCTSAGESARAARDQLRRRLSCAATSGRSTVTSIASAARRLRAVAA